MRPDGMSPDLDYAHLVVIVLSENAVGFSRQRSGLEIISQDAELRRFPSSSSPIEARTEGDGILHIDLGKPCMHRHLKRLSWYHSMYMKDMYR